MPRYCYRCAACGIAQEIVAGMHDPHPETLPCLCGGDAERDFAAEQGGAHNRYGKELWCEHNPYDAGPGAEVAPEQIAETNAAIRRRGIPGVHCVPSADGLGGRIVVTSKRGWKQYAEACGYFNKDAGYGDPAPTGRHRNRDPEFITIEER